MFWLLLLFICLGLLNWQLCLLILLLIAFPPLGIAIIVLILIVLLFEEKENGD